MKIRVLSLLNEASGVGRVTAETLGHGLGGDVDLAVIPVDDPPYHGIAAPVLIGLNKNELVRELRSADLPIYVLSDNSRNRVSVEMSYTFPGLALVHDVNLFHLMAPIVESRWGLSSNQLLQETLQSAIRPHLTQPADLWREDFAMADRLSEHVLIPRLLGPALLGASACITHSEWAASRIGPYCVGPVFHARLPWTVNLPRDGATTAEVIETAGRYFVTIGHVNSNRGIPRIARAIAALRNDGHETRLVVAGPAEAETVTQLRSQLPRNSQDWIRFTGSLSDTHLAEVVKNAVAALVIRDPVLEASSASTLYAMHLGVPTIVLDHAHYSELPDESVIKVPPDASAGLLAERLLQLLHDDDFREVTAFSGVKYASDPSRASEYRSVLEHSIQAAYRRIALVGSLREAGSVWRGAGDAFGEAAAIFLGSELCASLKIPGNHS